MLSKKTKPTGQIPINVTIAGVLRVCEAMHRGSVHAHATYAIFSQNERVAQFVAWTGSRTPDVAHSHCGRLNFFEVHASVCNQPWS